MSYYEDACCNPTCAAKVCLTEAQFRHHKERGTSFYCAAGHSQVFTVSENEKLRQKLRQVTESRDFFEWQWKRERSTFRCPFAKCFVSYKRAAGLASHLVREHGAHSTPTRKLRALPEDAGPDAHGSGA